MSNNTVYLIEDNAGGLFISKLDGIWYDVTPVQNDGTFADDAAALATGDTDDWTVEQYTDTPMGEVVGEWDDGHVITRPDACGRAAHNYLRLDSE